MERPSHVQKAHASTTDLLSWTVPPSSGAPFVGSGHAFHSGARSHQPSNDMRNALSGGQITGKEVDSLNGRSKQSEGPEISQALKAEEETRPNIEGRLEVIEGNLKGLKEDMSVIKESLLRLENMLKKVL